MRQLAQALGHLVPRPTDRRSGERGDTGPKRGVAGSPANIRRLRDHSSRARETGGGRRLIGFRIRDADHAELFTSAVDPRAIPVATDVGDRA